MPATLLLADDSITIQRVIELTFADEDVRVVSVSDGDQAIKRINAEPPDIVLADVGMPKVDGYGVAAHVKQTPALRHIPVLLLTGAFEPIDEAKARATECDGILVKPFEPKVLIDRVRELLAGQRSEKLWPADLPRIDAPAAPAPVRSPAPPVSPAPASRPIAMGPSATERPAAEAPVFVEAPRTHSQPDILRPANRNPPAYTPYRTQSTPNELPPPADAFESELDMLDVALSRLEPTANPQELDAATASDFARDLHELRSEQPEAPAAAASAGGANRQMFGDWDLPAGRATYSNDDSGADATEPIDIVPEEIPAPVVTPPPVIPAPLAPAPRPSLASAFSSLLAAEREEPQARAALASSPSLSESAIEDVVKRVLARMTDEAVHKVVLDAAERIIREEIDRLKSPTNSSGR